MCIPQAVTVLKLRRKSTLPRFAWAYGATASTNSNTARNILHGLRLRRGFRRSFFGRMRPHAKTLWRALLLPLRLFRKRRRQFHRRVKDIRIRARCTVLRSHACYRASQNNRRLRQSGALAADKRQRFLPRSLREARAQTVVFPRRQFCKSQKIRLALPIRFRLVKERNLLCRRSGMLPKMRKNPRNRKKYPNLSPPKQYISLFCLALRFDNLFTILYNKSERGFFTQIKDANYSRSEKICL